MGTIVTIQGGVGHALRWLEAAGGLSRDIALRSLTWLERQMEKQRSRYALMELSDEQLKDIGLSRSEAYREGSRPFWH